MLRLFGGCVFKTGASRDCLTLVAQMQAALDLKLKSVVVKKGR